MINEEPTTHRKLTAEDAASAYVDFAGDAIHPLRKQYEKYYAAGWNGRPVPTWKKINANGVMVLPDTVVLYRLDDGKIRLFDNGHPSIAKATHYMYLFELSNLPISE